MASKLFLFALLLLLSNQIHAQTTTFDNSYKEFDSTFEIFETNFESLAAKLDTTTDEKIIIRNLGVHFFNFKLHQVDNYIKRLSDSTKNSFAFGNLHLKRRWMLYAQQRVAFPDIHFLDSLNSPVALKTLQTGPKYYIVDVWASWCVTCRSNFDHFKTLFYNMPPEDVSLITVSIDKDIDAWRKAIQDDELTGSTNVVVDSSSLDSELFGNVPRTFLLDKDFKLVGVYGGTYFDMLRLRKTLYQNL